MCVMCILYRTTEKLEEFLSHNNGRNFVKSHGRDVQKFIQKQGLDKTFFECEHRMWRVGDRKLPKGKKHICLKLIFYFCSLCTLQIKYHLFRCYD